MFDVIQDVDSWLNIYHQLPEPKTFLHPNYVRAAATLEEDGHAELAVWVTDDTLIAHPYVRRKIPSAPSHTDIISAFEFGGFWISRFEERETEKAVDNFLCAFDNYCRDQSIISEFVRFHPFLKRPSCLAEIYSVRKHADNIILRLNRPYAEIFASYHNSKQKQVRQGRRQGLQISPSGDLETFVSVYHENLDRLEAAEFYYFPISFFNEIKEFTDLRMVYDADQDLCAAHCYLRDGDILHAFLCHARAPKLSLRPNDYAYDEVIAQSLENFGVFHFGGGAPSLAAYKRQFSSQSIPYFTGTRIFLPELYEDFTRARNAENRQTHVSGYFPAYRAS